MRSAAAGVAGGIGLDKLSNWVGQEVTGDTKGDYSISGAIGKGLYSLDESVSSLWADPSQPAYTQTLLGRQRGTRRGKNPMRTQVNSLRLRGRIPRQHAHDVDVKGTTRGWHAKPLDPNLRSRAEARFGHDFGQVQVHSGAAADVSADAIGASAYTVGHDIVLSGQVDLERPAGQWILAHELAHVVQQGGADAPDGELDIGAPDAIAEQRAERAAAHVMSNRAGPVASAAPDLVAPAGGGAVQRYIANPDIWENMPSLEDLPSLAGGAISDAGGWLGGTVAGLGASEGASAISAGATLGAGVSGAGSWLGDLIGGDTGSAISEGAGSLGKLALTAGSLLGGGLTAGGAMLGSGISDAGSALGSGVAGVGELDPSWWLM